MSTPFQPVPPGSPICIQKGCPPYGITCVACGGHISHTTTDALWWRLTDSPYNAIDLAVGLCATCCERIDAARIAVPKEGTAA